MEAHRIRPVDVSRRGGPSRPTLHRIHTNPDYEPDEITLNRLADALGVSRIWLREGTGPMDSPTYLATGGGKAAAAMEMLKNPSFMPSLVPGFGARIGMARQELGMSITAASMALKIPKRRLEAIEIEAEVPTLPELMAITVGYQANVRHLTTGQSEAPMDLVRESAIEAYRYSRLDRDLLSRALAAALAFRPKRDPDRMATAITDAYDTASKPGNADKMEELVRALLK